MCRIYSKLTERRKDATKYLEHCSSIFFLIKLPTGFCVKLKLIAIRKLSHCSESYSLQSVEKSWKYNQDNEKCHSSQIMDAYLSCIQFFWSGRL